MIQEQDELAIHIARWTKGVTDLLIGTLEVGDYLLAAYCASEMNIQFAEDGLSMQSIIFLSQQQKGVRSLTDEDRIELETKFNQHMDKYRP